MVRIGTQLPIEHMFTDGEFCAGDAMNAGTGDVLMTRLNIGPGRVKYDTPVAQSILGRAGMQILRVCYGTNRHKRNPSMVMVMGQPQGRYLFEFGWNKPKARDYHVACIDCDNRVVLCNTLGVVPFRYNNIRESQGTHRAVSSLFFIQSVTRVWLLIHR